MVVSRIGAIATALVVFLPAAPETATLSGGPQSPGKVREWPCRVVAEPPLFQMVERAWRMSGSFRRQCEALAEKRAVADLRPGASTSSGSLALSRITIADDGVVVGRVTVPLADNTIELIAHELEHILERAEGVDLLLESRRSNPGVWKALDGFETQRAIDMGRQVAREVRDSVRAAR